MKHCYEQSKHKVEPKYNLKRNDKAKGKWPPKRGRPQHESEKDNAVPYKKFNTAEKGHEEKWARGCGKERLQCWICGKDHCKRDYPQYHSGGRPHIYSAKEAHTDGDVGHNISRIYAVVDNREANHWSLRWTISFVIKLFLF